MQEGALPRSHPRLNVLNIFLWTQLSQSSCLKTALRTYSYLGALGGGQAHIV